MRKLRGLRESEWTLPPGMFFWQSCRCRLLRSPGGIALIFFFRPRLIENSTERFTVFAADVFYTPLPPFPRFTLSLFLLSLEPLVKTAPNHPPQRARDGPTLRFVVRSVTRRGTRVFRLFRVTPPPPPPRWYPSTRQRSPGTMIDNVINHHNGKSSTSAVLSPVAAYRYPRARARVPHTSPTANAYCRKCARPTLPDKHPHSLLRIGNYGKDGQSRAWNFDEASKEPRRGLIPPRCYRDAEPMERRETSADGRRMGMEDGTLDGN